MQHRHEPVPRTMKTLSLLVASSLLLVPLHAGSEAQPPSPSPSPPPTQAQAQAPSAPPASRGELLYGNHCIACHSTSVHWRDRRLVTDFGSLIAQVGRWQQNAGLGWSSEEILDVVQYLNATIYRFPNGSPQQKG